MKKVIVCVDCCRECPFADKIEGSEASYKRGWFYCNHLDKEVDSLMIDEDCPLEEE